MALREPYTEAARYALLSELALSLSEASDMEALTREFVPKLKYMIDFNRCTLALLEEDGTTYRLLILLETRQETSQASSDNISLQCGISGKVILSEEMCVLDSRGRNWVKQWPIADEAMEGGSLNSIMCLPLQVSGKPFGAITFGTGQIGYSRADISMASIIANHLSLAIDRWNMIQKLRSANEEVQKLNAELETRVQERTDELAKTNKQLSEEKERYRNLYLKTPAVLHSIDAEGELVSVSDFWLEKFGYTREEVIGRKSVEFLTEESREFSITEAIPQMKKQGYVRGIPLQFVKKNGEIMDILLSATVELGENGNYWRSLAVLEDVTERKRAEEGLKASQERYRSLYTKTPVMLHSIDATGKLISVSDYWLDNLGYELSEVIGRRIPEFLTQASRQDAENIFLREFFKTGFLKEEELQFVKKNGEIIDVLLSAIAERDANGEIVRSMAVLVDVTERKQAKEALQKAHDELEIRVQERTAELSQVNELLANKNEELESFAYSVSHDLQAPLRSIDGFSKALLEDCADSLNDSGKDFLNRVRAASQRMGHLIDDMLHLSRVSRTEMIPTKKIDLSAMAKTITQELHEEQSERQVTFVIMPEIEVSGDVHLLRIALENLLDNAWKYTSKHPRAKIEFGVTEHEGKKAYFVRDDGAGFDTKFVGKLFGPFQRLHRSNEFEGNGIGLATVQRIIHRHGGRVWAEGAVEKGATFFFTRP